MVISAFES